MIYEKLNKAFDFVGVIDKERYLAYKDEPLLNDYESIFVVGLAYPDVYLKHQKDRLAASMYTYGYDYHDVLKQIMDEALKDVSEDEFLYLVDNHEIHEQKCLELTGLAYHAKNNLMIHKEFGSYFFIGLVLSKKRYQEVIEENVDSCGDCDICIRACPVSALTNGFDASKCISAYNQSKRALTDYEISKNFLLLGCDICQRVCPKNRGLSYETVEQFEAKPTAYVLINDLFELSNREFMDKYGKHAYTWRGKTLLLRNALTIILKQKNAEYNDQIRKTLIDDKYPIWYHDTAKKVLEKLEQFEI